MLHSFGRTDHVKRWAENLTVVGFDPRNHRIGLPRFDHRSREVDGLVEIPLRLGERQPAPRASLEQGLREFVPLGLVLCGIDDLDAFQVDTHRLGLLGDSARAPEQHRSADPVLEHLRSRTDHIVVVSFREDDTCRLSTRTIGHPPHDLPTRPERCSEPIAILVHVEFGTSEAGLQRSLCYRGCDVEQHAIIERLRNQILPPEADLRSVIRAPYCVRHLCTRQIGQGMCRCQHHLRIDPSGAHIECSPENEREAEDVVHLIGIV